MTRTNRLADRFKKICSLAAEPVIKLTDKSPRVSRIKKPRYVLHHFNSTTPLTANATHKWPNA